MELQQQGIPGYGLYGRHYGQQPGGQHDPGFRGPPMPGGYPFPPMPGQPNYGYSHLGYPSSQSPGPREGEESSLTQESHKEAPAPVARAHPQPKSELLIPKCRLFAITPILPIIYSSWSRSMTRGMAGANTPVTANTPNRTQISPSRNTPNTNKFEPRIAFLSSDSCCCCCFLFESR